MRRDCVLLKCVSMVVALSLSWMGFFPSGAGAALVDTETVLRLSRGEDVRDRLHAFLDREEVRAVMAAQGLTASEAKARVDGLSDGEVARLIERLDELPAGGDAVGALIGAAVFIFVLLLITDLLGLTHAFSFVNHPRR